MALRTKLFSLPYGDQALFVSRAAFFNRLQGFKPLLLMEDVDLVHRARRLGPPAVVPMSVTTSARRWQSLGLMQTSLFNLGVYSAWCLGADERVLARCYQQKRFDAAAIAKSIAANCK